jgi:rfaE bifunctional protein nucleotidyltransferase chain/domain/rfaE bifunctional protein kinase chain/domain
MGDALVVVGDALLDRDVEGHAERLAPDAPVPVVQDPVVHSRPGGAGLAALLARRRGAHVTLVTALGEDGAGAELAASLEDAGVEVVDLRRRATPVKTRVRVDGHALVRLDDGADDGEVVAPQVVEDVAQPDGAVVVADYGLGTVAHPLVRRHLGEWAKSRPLVWDPHPRGASPVPGARLATPNRAEAGREGLPVRSISDATDAAVVLATRWRVHGVAVTLGADGAVVGIPGRLPLAVPAPVTVDGDACGAGDCFAVSAASWLAQGKVLTEAVVEAVADATTFVANGGVACLRADHEPPRAPADRLADIRRRGGTIVATSGCFDLLHAGHVAMLEAARRLGDALVVLLNSDRSVQDLKGAERPVVGQADRAAVLRGLACVDAVEVFDEVTPIAALERLRPQLFVKGDDYGAGVIPEAQAMRPWGGTVVVVPYLEGRSTTSLIAELGRDA